MARYKEKKHYENWRISYLKKLDRFTRGGHDIVYMDETGFAPGTSRSYGYGLKGVRIYGEVDSNKRPRTSLIGGYRNGKLIAPVLFNGNCNTDTTNVWFKDHLLPVLRKGSVIVMDNASFHKSQETRDIIKDAGCFVLFLPPYSPHLNPIEKLWANIKRAWKYDLSHSLENILVSLDFIWN
jgi:transposase